MELRYNQDSQFWQLYRTFLQEYENLDHMELA